MLFSSSVFLFFFLPGTLFVYYACKGHRRIQNYILCILSLLFYAWGEPAFVFIMLASIIINWLFGLLIDHKRDSETLCRLIIAADVVVNLSILFVFKYLTFTLRNIQSVFHANMTIPDIALPIGISFFTFQAMSYVIDVYRGKGAAQKNIMNVALYISFFPQLIAGPIVRYETIADQIANRKESFSSFSDGVARFIIGFSKKIIIANNMAIIADKAFEISAGTATWFGVSIQLSSGMAWIGALAYTFQIFFDFSGYSDMAIGLGKMFGFEFLENFNYPYISKSVTEFWRRWHISLSTWFRDYLYIPLGGNRCSKARNLFNTFVVWLCTGIWHGANWTFIAWGMLYFVLLMFERSTGLNKDSDSTPQNVFRWIYTMLFVIVGWVIFRADDLSGAISYITCMFSGWGPLDDPAVYYLQQYGFFLLAAILFSTPIVPWIRKRVSESSRTIRLIGEALSGILLVALLIVSISFMVKGNYNPFIYFNF